MKPLMFLLSLSLFTIQTSADPNHNPNPPSPGYNPSSQFTSLPFDQVYANLWGPSHQRVNNGSLTIYLDSSSGSGFKSLEPYRNGYVSAAVKLQSGYTAGVITSLYLSNNQDRPDDHDEIDIEFLGTIPGKSYILQTNVYVNGSGDGDGRIGREVRHRLWFDPARDFHNYAIQWTSNEIIFFVDDVPIRRYAKKRKTTPFPVQPMWVYGSIWDASSWATEGGRYKADYTYQPFLGRYEDFKIGGCTVEADASCRPPSMSPSGAGGLSRQQRAAMKWVRRNYLVYDYCNDKNRDRSKIPEC